MRDGFAVYGKDLAEQAHLLLQVLRDMPTLHGVNQLRVISVGHPHKRDPQIVAIAFRAITINARAAIPLHAIDSPTTDARQLTTSLHILDLTIDQQAATRAGG